MRGPTLVASHDRREDGRAPHLRAEMLLCLAVAAVLLLGSRPADAAAQGPVLGVAQANPGGAGRLDEAPPTAPIEVRRMPGPANYVGAPPSAAPEAAPPPEPEPSAPPLGTNFQGIGYTFFFPPDPIMAAGPSDLVLVVNGGIALFTKAGVNALQDTLNNFYNGSLSGTFTYDPKILYDPHSSRFFTVALDGQASPNSWLRIAVSKSNNPNDLDVGPLVSDDWWGYNIDADLDGGVQANFNWADYPGLGVDQFNLYVTANMFSNAGAFQYSKVWIIPKAGLIAGGPITVYEFGAPPAFLVNPATGFKDFTIQPVIDFDLTNEHMVATNALGGPNGWITFWTVNTPGGVPSLSAMNLMVPGWNGWSPPDCPQLGDNANLDTGDPRILNAIERGGRIWATHTQPDPTLTRPEVRWYEINPVGPALVQFGQVTSASRCYFYPAIHPDAAGNACLVMSGVDATIFGSAFYTGRLAGDPAGTMQAVALLRPGLSNYVMLDPLARNRWGDYGGIAADPATGGLWMFHEYASATPNQWSTWAGDCVLPTPITTTTTTTTASSTTTTTTSATSSTTTTTLGALIEHPQDALKLILKQNTATAKEKAVLVVKPFGLGLPTASPIDVGATYSVTGLDQTGTTSLPASGWQTNSGGTLYKFINKSAPSGPSLCKVALVKANTVLKVVCKDSMIDLDDAAQGEVRAKLAIGDDVYCVECAAPLKDEPGKYIAKGCLAPVGCLP